MKKIEKLQKQFHIKKIRRNKKEKIILKILHQKRGAPFWIKKEKLLNVELIKKMFCMCRFLQI